MNERPVAQPRGQYRHFLPIQTRWSDNDVYGHVNNVVYYGWFDTVVNEYLIASGALDIQTSPVVGLVVATQCSYFSELSFPQKVDAGLRVAHLGTSSVRYEVALFAQGQEQASAQGYFIHVYVDRQSRRPVALPPPLRAAVERLRV